MTKLRAYDLEIGDAVALPEMSGDGTVVDFVYVATAPLNQRSQVRIYWRANCSVSDHPPGDLNKAQRRAKVDPSTVDPGLYKIHWHSGGSSLAAVGVASNGDRWIAATNWVEHTSVSWSDVLRIEPVA